MCMHCSPLRAFHGQHHAHPGVGQADAGANSHRVNIQAPISRARLLKMMGGGLAGALAAGMVNWNPTGVFSDSLPYVVLIVLDGARAEYLDIAGIPHVKALVRGGTRYSNAFSGILESETPSGHVAIGTGSEPRKTGIPSFWWGTSGGVRMSLFSPAKIRAGDMEKIIRQSGVPTLAGRVHARSKNARVVALSGSKYYAADAIGGPEADVTMYYQGLPNNVWAPTSIPGHTAPATVLNAPGLTGKTNGMALGVQNHLAMKLAVESFTRMRQQVTLINLPEFDWPLGHVDGGIKNEQGVRTLMHGFDNDLAMLQDAYRRAGVLNRTVFVVMADHGMSVLRRTISQSDITDAVARAGTTLVAQTYTSAIYLWLKDRSRASSVAQNLTALQNPGIQSIYVRTGTANGAPFVAASRSSLMRTQGMEGANQYLLNTFRGSNAPDVVILLAEGVGCEPGGQSSWKADHGGTSWQAQHLPLVLSGPGIRSNYVSSYPARLIDVAPTLLQLMGASHNGMQGIPLADALTAPPSWAVRWQRTAATRLNPIVHALQQQSQLELKTAI